MTLEERIAVVRAYLDGTNATMTPEVRARLVTARWVTANPPEDLDDLDTRIIEAIREAVAEEREACAALCAGHSAWGNELAALIDARGE